MFTLINHAVEFFGRYLWDFRYKIETPKLPCEYPLGSKLWGLLLDILKILERAFYWRGELVS